MADAPTSLDDFGLFDHASQQCPHAYYAMMREQQPVFPAEVMGGTIHLVTTYDDVVEVLKNPEIFSSNFGGPGGPSDSDLADRLRTLYRERNGYPRVATMLTADPPTQTRYRKLVAKAFTPRAIANLEPVIRSLCGSLIDGFVSGRETGSTEFVESFAVPLPVTVIAKALNVPNDRLDDFKRWSDDSIAGIGTNIGADELVAAEEGVIEFQHYFAEQINIRRDEPQDDLLTNLLNARIDRDEDGDLPDDPLNMAEMLSILQQLLVAGNETTTKMLTELMRLLGEHPERWAELRSDPDRAAAIVEETLRLSTPTQGMWRVVTQDTTLSGVAIPAGARIVIMFASANRDEQYFADGDGFDPDRAGLANHLAFGKGIHYCVGANLSRLEGRVAAQELSKRLATISLPDSNTFDYHPSFMLRGLKRLDLGFVAAER